MARLAHLHRPGKESYRYTVEAPQCRGNAACSVNVAVACAGGFGPGFLVEADRTRGRVEVDPAWWLTHYTYTRDDSPFSSAFLGICEARGFDPNHPYNLYGALERAGDKCCVWTNGKLYTTGIFEPIDCGGGWQCMTYCILQ